MTRRKDRMRGLLDKISELAPQHASYSKFFGAPFTAEVEAAIDTFVTSEVTLALGPHGHELDLALRDPSPELAEAERWLRAGGFSPPKMAVTIAAELTRLREELRHRTIDANIHADSMRGERDIWRTRAKEAEAMLAELWMLP